MNDSIAICSVPFSLSDHYTLAIHYWQGRICLYFVYYLTSLWKGNELNVNAFHSGKLNLTWFHIFPKYFTCMQHTVFSWIAIKSNTKIIASYFFYAFNNQKPSLSAKKYKHKSKTRHFFQTTSIEIYRNCSRIQTFASKRNTMQTLVKYQVHIEVGDTARQLW